MTSITSHSTTLVDMPMPLHLLLGWAAFAAFVLAALSFAVAALLRRERAELLAVDEYQVVVAATPAEHEWSAAELRQIAEEAPDPDGWSNRARGFDYLDKYRQIVEGEDLVTAAGAARPAPVEPDLYERLSGWHDAINDAFEPRWLDCTTDFPASAGGRVGA